MFKSFFHRALSAQGAVEFLVVGLGNPGERYAMTRHNAGFMALDAFCQLAGLSIKKLQFRSLCGQAEIQGHKVILMKPSTFMNNSGEAVRDAAAFYKIPPERIIVIFDDISLDVGKMRIRRKGSDGGHNGIKSIIYQLGSDQFPRIKIGVGKKPHPDYDLAQWVLSRFSKEELSALKGVFEDASKALELLIGGEIEQAMNRYNS